MRINFNSMTLGLSGGNRYIFELSNQLVERGHKVTITHAGLPKYHKWFSPIKADIIECGYSVLERALIKAKLKRYSQEERLERLASNVPDCDVNIATYCLTAKPTVDSGKGQGFYLVQHYEPSFFNPCTKNRLLAEDSYDLPLKKLCVSKWLADKVGGQYVGDGINLQKFKESSERKVHNSVMLMVRKGVSWKRPKFTQEVASVLSDCGYSVFMADGNLTDQQLIAMYQKSMFFIYLSDKEGFGLPPLEAMACGCVVISTPCCPFLKDMCNAYLLVEVSLTSILFAMSKLTHNKVLCSLLVSGGLDTSKQFDFTKVVDRFESCVGCT